MKNIDSKMKIYISRGDNLCHEVKLYTAAQHTGGKIYKMKGSARFEK